MKNLAAPRIRNSSPVHFAFTSLATLIALCVSISTATAQHLDLTRYRLNFEEDFSNLSVSANGPGTRWIAHTPWLGDFGEAQFVDPKPNFPFSRDGNAFGIIMKKQANGRWESGLLASVDMNGKGFAQQFGYFEISTKLPAGPGVWPAFWLSSFVPLPLPDPSVEIDVFEHYGKFPGAFNSTVTVWPKFNQPKPPSKMFIKTVSEGTLSNQFHRFGVEVKPDWIIFYLDSEEYWRTKTPPEHKYPLMILVDLALGGGWPTAEAPATAVMEIQYIRAYAPASPP